MPRAREDRERRDVSRLKRDRSEAKLTQALQAADRLRLMLGFWAIETMRSGRPELAAQVLAVTRDQANQELGSPWAIHGWELETLANLAVLQPPAPRSRRLKTGNFEAFAYLAGQLRQLENAEYGLRETDVLMEMHRIAQRQFSWQRGVSLQDFYRPILVYGQGEYGGYFERTHGLSVSQFAFLGFALFAWFSNSAVARVPFPTAGPDLSEEQLQAGISLLSLPFNDARGELEDMLRANPAALGWPTAYKPSLLRRRPVLSIGNQLIAPIPALIVHRVTQGLFYDVVAAGDDARNEAAARFERYVQDFISATAPRFRLAPEYAYQLARRREQRSPDLLVFDGDALAIVIECKSTKMTLAAQFSPSPVEDAAAKYRELVKGVFQLWRFFSHCRRGLTGQQAAPQTKAVLLTLDTWLVMAGTLRERILADAGALADTDGSIMDEDRRSVIFAAAPDFESLFAHADEDGILATLEAALRPQYDGWLLPSIRQQAVAAPADEKPYPFHPGDILPWWRRYEQGEED